MNLENDQQLANTEYKLNLLKQQIEIARASPCTGANDASRRSLIQMANQLTEEIVRYRSAKQRRAAS